MSDRDAIDEAIFQRLRRNLRTLRRAAGLTQKTAAERAEMRWWYWQRIEAGEINIRLPTLVRMTEALGVDVAVLLRDPERQVSGEMKNAAGSGGGGTYRARRRARGNMSAE